MREGATVATQGAESEGEKVLYLQDAVLAGRLIERMGWDDAVVVEALTLQDEQPNGPRLVVTGARDLTVDLAKHLAALVGAGRSVELVSAQDAPADVAGWLPTGLQSSLSTNSSVAPSRLTSAVAATFEENLRHPGCGTWEDLVRGGGVEDDERDAPWPRISMEIPNSEERNWSVSVPFGAWDTEYWDSENTAILFAPYRVLGEKARGYLIPSLGESYQDAGGLMGMATIEDGSGRRCVGGAEPLWWELSHNPGERELVPSAYRDSQPSKDESHVAPTLPLAPINYLLEVSSYALGMSALLHGLPALMSEIEALNDVLASFEVATE